MIALLDNINRRPEGLLNAVIRAYDRGLIKFALIIALTATLVLTVTGCEDFSPPAPSPPSEEPERVVGSTAIRTADRATMAVYEHLLEAAESHEAKRYLAEFYAVSDNWSAEKELLQDGSTIWYVTINTTASGLQPEKPHWQQAGWFILQNGRVIPSYRFQSNALRIEADLQELSLAPDRQPVKTPPEQVEDNM